MQHDDLDSLAQRHLDPLGITLAEAETDAAGTEPAPARYSSAGALDALRRLRAKITGQVSPTATFAPILPPTFPLVICAAGGHVQILDEDTTIGTDLDHLIQTLADLGVSTQSPTHRTLVVDTPATLRLLTRAAMNAEGHPDTAQALDWWTQRADHPGSGAALVLTRALPLRWVTGETPQAERHLTTWQRWLAQHADPLTTTSDTTRSLARMLAAGQTLPDLLTCHEDDSYSWQHLPSPGRWHHTDTRRDAALGLTGRCHAAEFYDSLRLADPTVAQLAVRTGTLVEATITDLNPKTHTMTLVSQNLTSRLRQGARVQAWQGAADASRASGALDLSAGVVSTVAVTAQRELVLGLAETVLPGKVATGEQLTVRPRRIDPFQQRSFRSRYRTRYLSQQNWLARKAQPTPARRSVPMDVVIAAADSSE